MIVLPGFADLLARLLDHRGLTPADLARRTEAAEPAAAGPGPAEAEVAALLAGAAPEPALLRRLGPALGLDAADLFQLAALPLPEDLAPAGGMATTTITGVVRFALALPPAARAELRSRVAELPPARHRGRIEGLPASVPDRHTPGNLVMRMVATRNLGWNGTAKAVQLLTGHSRMATVYGRIASGEAELTAELVADLAIVLALPAADLAAVVGLPLPADAAVPSGAVTDAALLLRDLRCLGVEQLREAEDLARALSPA
ncbi:hypothetical protein [Kitasatospora sp. NPDC059599]|uniref:hypothetical protein n=1 Tax=Kitasatospora sp. NPDC059599 TaxID=3346880 RepID=UPI00369341FB